MLFRSLQQKAKPFSMFKGPSLRRLLKLFEAFGHAVQAKSMEKVDGGMDQHDICPSVEVIRAADIGMVIHARTFRSRGSAIAVVLKNGGNARVSKSADGHGVK